MSWNNNNLIKNKLKNILKSNSQTTQCWMSKFQKINKKIQKNDRVDLD
jgi:hypothetical protein